MTFKFLLIYELKSGRLFQNGKLINRCEHRTCSGDLLVFKTTHEGLELRIPFFLLDNVFYYQSNGLIYFSQHLCSFDSLTPPDLDANKLLNTLGFLPHSRTQLVGVKILCSYLTYKFSKSSLVIAPCYTSIETIPTQSVDDLMDCFRIAFRKRLEKVNSDRFILPLSGGMDSRLLLELALDIKDLDLNFFTLGTRRSGDVQVARKLVANLGLEKKHTIFNIEDLNKDHLIQNYYACDYLLPLDRLLYCPLGKFYQKSAVFSGLYGDVIFADNKLDNSSYVDYLVGQGVIAHTDDDYQIIAAYNKLPKLPKLHRTLLRCQKLTRLSFVISPGFEYIAPFVDPQVITVASSIRASSIYSSLIANHMRPALKTVIHQSTLSYFTHPHWLRFVERNLFKLFRHPARLPYFDSQYLGSKDIHPNEAPPIDMK